MGAIGPQAASADPVAALQAKAALISSQLLKEQLQIGGYEQQYEAATQAEDRDISAIAQAQLAIARDDERVAADHKDLTAQVIAAYIDAGSVPPRGESALFASSETTDLRLAEYQQMAVGDVQTSLAILRTDEQQLAVVQAVLQQRRAHDAQLVVEQGQLLASSNAAQSLMEQQQGQVNGELAVAIAQQQSARASAAQAAVRAAQAAAARSSGSAGTPTGSQGGDAASDPALNAFLQCVVQAESGGNYGAVSPGGEFMGAFQFSQATWNEAASLAGLPALIGVPPNLATKADQDTLAVALYALDGERPWYDPCKGAG
jgi:hypothetical protein